MSLLEQRLTAPDERVLELPAPPAGYIHTINGLLIPSENHFCPAEGSDDVPDDIRVDEQQVTEPQKEPLYLWTDPAAALNRTMASASLYSLQNTFGSDLHAYTEIQPIIELLNTHMSRKDYESSLIEYYQLIEEVNKKIEDEVLEAPGVWDYLGLMADHFMIQSNMEDLPMSDTLHDLLLRGLATDTVPEKLLDFIGHFDLPDKIVEGLLNRIDCNPNHPLYWWVADRQPEHPVVRQQREAVVSMLEQTDNEEMMYRLAPQTLLPLGSLLDDRHFTFPRSGLELETNCPIGGVKVPKKTKMGTDGARDGSILELRIDEAHYPEAIDYDAAWRRRYFEIWRWEQISYSISSSIHLHSEGNDPNKCAAAHLLFGYSYNSCRNNNIGTIEVRTALSGYMDDQLKGRGFSTLPHPALIELLHSCSNQDDTTRIIRFLSQARLSFTEYDDRIASSSGESIQEILEGNDFDKKETLAEVVGGLEEPNQSLVVESLIEDHDEYVKRSLIRNLGGLNERNQSRVIEAVLKGDDSRTKWELAENASSLNEPNQSRVTKAILDGDDASARFVLIKNADKLNEQNQSLVVNVILRGNDRSEKQALARIVNSLINEIDRSRVVRATLRGNDLRAKQELVRNTGSLNSRDQSRLAKAMLRSGDRRAELELARNAGGFNERNQSRVVEAMLGHKDREMKRELAENASGLKEPNQSRVVEAILGSDDFYVQLGLVKCTGSLNEPNQSRVVEAMLGHNNREMKRELAENASGLKEPNQSRVVEAILESDDFYVQWGLVKCTGSLNEPNQSRVVEAVLGGVDQTSKNILFSIVNTLPERHRIYIRQHIVVANEDNNSLSKTYNAGRLLV